MDGMGQGTDSAICYIMCFVVYRCPHLSGNYHSYFLWQMTGDRGQATEAACYKDFLIHQCPNLYGYC